MGFEVLGVLGEMCGLGIGADIAASVPPGPVAAVLIGLALIFHSLWDTMFGARIEAALVVDSSSSRSACGASLQGAAPFSPMSCISMQAVPTPLKKPLPSPARMRGSFGQQPAAHMQTSIEGPVGALGGSAFSPAGLTHEPSGRCLAPTPVMSTSFPQALGGAPGTPQRRASATAPLVVGQCYIIKLGKKDRVVRLDSLSGSVAYVSELQPYISQRSGRFGLSDVSAGKSIRVSVAEIPGQTGFQLSDGRAPAHIEKLFRSRQKVAASAGA